MEADKNNIAEWLEFADHDLDTAELLLEMRPQHYEIICYHCEQAAEKYLKGYLIAQGVMPPKTHDLDMLCGLCSESDASFDNIADECTYLSQFAVQPRYPYEMGLTENITQKARDCVQKIKSFKAIQDLHTEIPAENANISETSDSHTT
ncbi:MAG: HEPN domain-containing protein [Clostridiales Family XIII bacterium]|jgi:HEPN domain-containing protein|nr:HEPN domain-containing protein [Clostridiales Family XIII bacterium]